MQEKKLRVIIGVDLVIAHFAAILLLFVLYVLGGFDFDEMTTAIGIMSPMFVAYTSIIASYFVSQRFKTTEIGRDLEPAFVIMTILAPALFVMLILTTIIMKAFNIAFENFGQYKGVLLSVETVFGVYLGRFVPALFGEENQGLAEKQTTQSDGARKVAED